MNSKYAMPLFLWVTIIVADASHVYNTGVDVILEGDNFGTEDISIQRW
jgi:hypothetical protein